MASSIDATKPTAGAALTADVRNNFSAAKTEIEALQAAVASALVAKAGDTMTGALNWSATQTIASAATTDIGAATSNSVIVSGTKTITALGTIAAGAERVVQFSGALTLTHNATSLILPGGASITTAAGDVASFVSLGAGNWRCTGYQKANGVGRFSGLEIPGTGNIILGTNTGNNYIEFVGTNTTSRLTGNSYGDQLTCNRTLICAAGLHAFSGDIFLRSGTGGVVLGSVHHYGFSSNVDGAVPPADIRLYRGTAGRFDVCTSNSSTYGDVKLRSLIATGTITLGNVTVATLPTAASNTHAIVAVTDGNASPTYRGAVTGGGSTKGLVYCDGSSWMWH